MRVSYIFNFIARKVFAHMSFMIQSSIFRVAGGGLLYSVARKEQIWSKNLNYRHNPFEYGKSFLD